MKLDLARTIVAVGSGIASSRRAIVRVSGHDTRAILSRLFSQPVASAISDASQPVRICGTALLQLGAKTPPRSLPIACYWWPDSRSFTGEPCAELHVLGSLPIVESLVEQLVSLGARVADRGEFTLRSFLAGKIDLTQAEAVLGVIEAVDEDELQWALGNLAGNLSQPIRDLRNQLLELISHLEAGLDFVEEDIEFISKEALRSALMTIETQLGEISERLQTRGGRSRRPSVVLVGLPNSGKSTLFNQLLGFERAIVSNTAGTTRDVVSMTMKIGENEIELLDTAGVEELSESTPRGLAQSVLKARLTTADLLLLCIDPSQGKSVDWCRAQIARFVDQVPTIVIETKADLRPPDTPHAIDVDCRVAAGDQRSMEQLQQAIQLQLAECKQTRWTDALHQTALRCRESVQQARISLHRAIQGTEDEAGEEIIAAELRMAIDDLSAVIGEVHTEDILGEIFGRFCIGK